ncbi:MAG: PP2C family protein-serine/threonine phosphatase [Pirellulaceae bacterium]
MTGPRSIRFRLLAAVNATMALLLLGFLVVDYYREIADRVTQKHITLEEEAKTLLPAIQRLRPQGLPAVQEYLDAVCSQMHDVPSPGHHIGVRLDGRLLQAVAHRRASPEIFAAMETAARSPTHRASVGLEPLVVGSAEDGGASVYVSEYLTDIKQAAGRQVFRRLVGIVLLVVIMASVINLVFLRIVAKPLETLVETVRQIARGQLGVQAGPLKTAELAFLAEEINSMSLSLAEIDRDRRHEMDKARRIQEHLLPHDIGIPGLDVANFYQPATEVAGDYYDVVAVPDGSWLLCIADVSGHGVPAAMSAAMLKTLLLHAAEHCVRPAHILRFINDRFATVSLDGDFASMVLARWMPKTAKLEYASAGHGHAWFLPAVGGTPRELPSTGSLLGIQADSTWESECLELAARDRLLLTTDGITEAFNAQDEQFGGDRLASMFVNSKDIPLADFVQRIHEAWSAHRGNAVPTDDCTVLAVEFLRPHGDV